MSQWVSIGELAWMQQQERGMSNWEPQQKGTEILIMRRSRLTWKKNKPERLYSNKPRIFQVIKG